MKIRFLIIAAVLTVAGFAVFTSGVFTPLQSDISECYYTDENDIPKPCMMIDGWYDVLLQSTIHNVNNSCDPKYIKVGNNECILNPEFIKPNTVTIYDVSENSGTRLSITPHDLVMDLRDSNTVTFVNESLSTVNIIDNSKGLWRFDNVGPSSQRELVINGTGFYKVLIQNSRKGESGRIVALSEDTDSLPVEIRAKMAQSIVGSDFGGDTGLVSVGSGGAEPGITIDIHEKFEDNGAAKFYEKYRKMIPFDVPIKIEFVSPIMLATG